MRRSVIVTILIIWLLVDVAAFRSCASLKAETKRSSHVAPRMSSEESNELSEPRSFLQVFLSSRSKPETKSAMYEQVRKLRTSMSSASAQWDMFFDGLIEEVQSVQNNTWAMKRWPIPLPSYRVKLGALNRMWMLLVEQEQAVVAQSGSMQTERETQRRALGVLLGQLRTTPGIRKLEQESVQRRKRESSMDEMLDRTPKGLETPSYTVLDNRGTWEVRKYDSFSVCSLMMQPSRAVVEGEDTAPAAKQGTVSGGAFNSLAGYIFGRNQESQKMAMTTPVITSGSRSRMSFVMPSNYWGDETALQSAPRPMDDSGVQLAVDGGGLFTSTAAAIDGTAVAVKWFGGYANKVEAERMAKELRAAIQSDGRYEVVPSDEPYILMQYNDPFVPPWKRRNEVAIPVKKAAVV